MPGRGINYGFALAEVLWILGGRGDYEFIGFYNKNMKSFLDDTEGLMDVAKTTTAHDFHGSYGKRIRRSNYNEPNTSLTPRIKQEYLKPEEISKRDRLFYHGEEIDQLQMVFDKFQADMNTRQAVVTLWDPRKDNLVKAKDHPCLSGDTIIRSPEGDLSIHDLSVKFEAGIDKYPVYSFNEQTRDIEITYCTSSWKSGNKEAIKLTFDDGSELKCTPDHKLYQKIKDGHTGKTTIKIVEAKDLKANDRLWATHFKKKFDKHLSFVKNLSTNHAGSNLVRVHREYYEFLHGPIPDGYDVHHKDGNMYNNSKDNFELKLHGTHSSDHMKDNNPMSDKTVVSKVRGRGPHGRWHTGKFEDCLTCNHKIVSIDYIGSIDVYDFTVPTYHNAVTGTGLVTHNCNIALMFTLDEGKLDLLVIRRSNDVVWGLPYNIIQFTSILEYMAGWLGIPVGTYAETINSLHIYEDEYPDQYKFFVKKSSSDNLVFDMPVFDKMNGVCDKATIDRFMKYFFVTELEWRARIKSDTHVEVLKLYLERWFGELESVCNDPYWKSVYRFLLCFHLNKAKHFDTLVTELKKMNYQWRVMGLETFGKADLLNTRLFSTKEKNELQSYLS
jgi:thymidylate synthase